MIRSTRPRVNTGFRFYSGFSGSAFPHVIPNSQIEKAKKERCDQAAKAHKQMVEFSKTVTQKEADRRLELFGKGVSELRSKLKIPLVIFAAAVSVFEDESFHESLRVGHEGSRLSASALASDLEKHLQSTR